MCKNQKLSIISAHVLTSEIFKINTYVKVKGKVFYGQKPPSGESTTTECGFFYQLLVVIYCSSPMGSSQFHNQLRTIASETVDPNDWSHSPPYTGQYALSSTYCTLQCGLGCITRLAALSQPRSCDLRNARPKHCLCYHSGYEWQT